MADGIKISALTEATDAQTVDGNLLETAVVDSSSSTGFSSKKTTFSRFANYILNKFAGLSLAGESQTVKDAIDGIAEKKADTDGTYDDMRVGTADQLLSESYTVDRTPYKFRKAPYTDRLSESIVGASVAWNQLAPESKKSGSVTPDGTTTYSYFQSGIQAVLNHVYVISVDITYNGSKLPMRVYSQVGASMYGRPIQDISTAGKIRAEWIAKPTATPQMISFGISNLATSAKLTAEDAWSYDNLNIFDLTQMFGSTVADTLYNMGDDGVKLFRSWYPNDYYPYSAPTMEHVDNLESHDMVGFNVFDASTAVGNSAINGSGAVVSGTHTVSDFIKVLPSTEYYVLGVIASTSGRGVVVYDEDKTFIRVLVPNGISSATSGTVTTPTNAMYMRVMTDSPQSCNANLSDPTRNGTYKPYSKHSYALDASLTLRGLLKYDSSKGIYADGDTYKSDGTVERRFGVVDLGTLTWTYRTTGYNAKPFVAHLENAKLPPASNVIVDALITNKYVQKPPSVMNSATLTDAFAIGFYFQGDKELNVVDTAYTDVASFKASLSGVYLVYELATPTTESAEPYDEIQITDGTEEYITDCLVPVGHESRYYENLRSKIEGLPTDFSAIICATEATNKASKNYAVGDYLIYNNTLYKVTSAIATNAALTVGTNISATTIMAEIKALQ